MKPLIPQAELNLIAADLFDKCDLISTSIHRIEVNYSGSLPDHFKDVIYLLNCALNDAKSECEVVLNDGGNQCYQCGKQSAYLFDDSRCKDCTRLTLEEVQGGN